MSRINIFKHPQFLGGVSGLIIGAYVIFFLKDNIGFIPGILGAVLLFWER